MSRIDQYMRDVRLQLAGSAKDKERFISDLRDQANAMLENGESELSVIDHLGSPREVAAEFMKNRPLVYANILERSLAFIFDISLGSFVVFLGFFLVFVIPLGMRYPDVFWSLQWDPSAIAVYHINILEMFIFVVLGLMTLGITVFYFPILEHMYGWTLGKRVMGIRVLREDGTPISLGEGFIRRLSFYFDIITLDSIFILFTKTRQRAFDRVARTVVVRDGQRNLMGIFGFIVVTVLFILLAIYIGLIMEAIPEPVIDFL
ncbi:RDD family protein [bacterium]|nr:RDD family protein [bacterium]